VWLGSSQKSTTPEAHLGSIRPTLGPHLLRHRRHPVLRALRCLEHQEPLGARPLLLPALPWQNRVHGDKWVRLLKATTGGITRKPPDLTPKSCGLPAEVESELVTDRSGSKNSAERAKPRPHSQGHFVANPPFAGSSGEIDYLPRARGRYRKAPKASPRDSGALQGTSGSTVFRFTRTQLSCFGGRGPGRLSPRHPSDSPLPPGNLDQLRASLYKM
jgi:hypothetical protein